VFVHGFTQTGASWDPVLAVLGERGRQTTVDLPGHGWSGAVHTDLWGTATLLADVPHGVPATWVGYSLGARCSLHVALAHPHVVDRLVLVGATAGIESAAERATRIERDESLAERVEQVGVEAFLDEWLAQPLFAGLTDETDGRSARLANTPEGLAASLRLCGTGTQEPLWERLGEIEKPVLLVAGERDERFVAHARRMAGLLPDAAVAIVPGAGHAAHLEQPEVFVTAVLGWERAVLSR
jgi:2-succinyl-6-hydroxy-2,4-cyclohexadiene-1-carboxylate synthase